MYRTRPTIPPDLRRTIEEQRRTINELRQKVADLTGRIAAADSADGSDRRSLAAELQMHEQLLLTYADDLKALYRTVQQQGRRLRAAAQDVAKMLVNAMEGHDAGAGKHARDVAAVAEAIGRRLDLDEAALQTLRLGGLMHDLGNVILDRGLIAQAAPLSREQWQRVREHPVVGAALIADLPSLAAAAPAVRHHHERWDGKGYPDGLRGEAIPLAARAVAVAEVFVSMITPRPYRPGMTPEQAVGQSRIGAGAQLDRRCVAAFLAAWEAGEVPVGDAASAPGEQKRD